MCSPKKTLLVWRVMKFVLPVEREPRRSIVRFFFGVVQRGVAVDDIVFVSFFFLFSFFFSNLWEILREVVTYPRFLGLLLD